MSRIIREDILFTTTDRGEPVAIHKDYIVSIKKHRMGCEIEAVMGNSFISNQPYQEVIDKWLSAPAEHNHLLPIEPDTARPV